MSRFAHVRRATAFASALALGAGLAVIPGSLGAVASTPSASTAEGTTPAASLPEPDPDYAMPKIPVWVTIGDRGLPRVTVSVRDGRGKVRISARTNRSGVVLIPRTFLRGKHSLAVTGGDAWKRMGKPTLATGELIGSRNAAIIISPLTSIAHRVAQRMGISHNAALLRTRKAHGIAPHVNHIHAAATDLIFHTGQLQRWSTKHGSLHAGMDHLAKRIAQGKDVPHFKPSRSAQPRSETSSVVWAGEQIMSGLLSGSGSYGANVVMGDLFGAANPSTTLLGDINSEVQQVINDLVKIEATLEELVYLMEETSYQVLNAGMSNIEGAVNGNDTETGLWAVYLSATTLNPASTSYEADISGFAASFYNGVYSYLPTIAGELFDSPTATGLLHELYNFNTAPWWNSDDIAAVSATIDYYGTLQAQAVTLVNEAWWSPNAAYQQTPDDINSFNTTNYGPLSADIYLSMPTQIDDSQIALPKTQQVISAFPTTFFNAAYQQKTGNYANEMPTCSNDGQTVATVVPYPTIINEQSYWDDLWAAAMPSGWTVQGSSILNDLDATRKLPNASGDDVTTYTLSTFVQGVPNAFALVTSGQYPRAGFVAVNENAQPYPVIAEWMFCYNSGVPLDDLTNWQTNFEAVSAGSNLVGYTWDSKHVPAGAPTNWIDLPMPVGVLGSQSGSFKYVEPPPPSTS